MHRAELAPQLPYIHPALDEYVQGIEAELLQNDSNADPELHPHGIARVETTMDEEGNIERSVKVGPLPDANLAWLRFRDYWRRGENMYSAQPHTRSVEWAYGSGQPPLYSEYNETASVKIWGGGMEIYTDGAYTNWPLVADSRAVVDPNAPEMSCVTGKSDEDSHGLGEEFQQIALRVAIQEAEFAPNAMADAVSALARALRLQGFRKTKAGQQLLFDRTPLSLTKPFPETATE